MHEFTIAQSIIDTALSEVDAHKASRVKEMTIDVGELGQIDKSVLRQALKILLTDSKLKGARVRLHVTKVKFSCRKCGHKWAMDEAQKQLSKVPDSLRVREPDSLELPLHFLPQLFPAFLRCEKCGSADIGVVQGENVFIRSLLME